MDRVIVYPGAIPQDTDILSTNKNVMLALGALLRAAFGTSSVVDGFAVTQTLTPSMAVQVGPGAITQLSVVDSTAYGSLAADTADPLVKMGFMLQPTTLTITAPGTAGYSQNWLVEATFSEEDEDPVVLPYYNAANPQLPYSGPGNSGNAQNTLRQQTVSLTLKAGTAAPTGTETTPAPDAGYAGIAVVTVANGQSTIINSNITPYGAVPFIPAKLGPGMVPGFANEQIWTGYSAGTASFTVPAGYTQVRATLTASGAGGGGTDGTANSCGGGGGGSAEATVLIQVTAGEVLTLTYPQGGAGGVGGAAGAAGGTVSIYAGSTMLASLAGPSGGPAGTGGTIVAGGAASSGGSYGNGLSTGPGVTVLKVRPGSAGGAAQLIVANASYINGQGGTPDGAGLLPQIAHSPGAPVMPGAGGYGGVASNGSLGASNGGTGGPSRIMLEW
jgi:hypothetical protein